MNDKDKMYYRIHLSNGEVWYAHNFGYLKDVAPDFEGNWADLEMDYGMVEAILEKHLHIDVQPTPLVVCLYAVSAVEILTEPRIPRWHTIQRGQLENFL